MSDIVERLRVPSNLMTEWTHIALHGQAAAEIERLRARVAVLEKVREAANGMWDPFYKLHAALSEAALKAAREDKP